LVPGSLGRRVGGITDVGVQAVGGRATCRGMGLSGGAKSICQSRGALGPRVPLRMLVPSGSVTVSVLAVNRAVHPASHSVPMLMRLCVRPGTMCPCRETGGMVARFRVAVPEEIRGWPVAVWMVVRGAWALMLVRGVCGRR